MKTREEVRSWGKNARFWWTLSLITVLMILALLIPTRSHAAEEPAEKSFETSFSSKFFSQYVGDTGSVFYNKPVVQSDLTLSHKSGLYVNFWYSFSTDNPKDNTNGGKEVDYTLAWAGEVSGINVDAGVSYFDIAPTFDMPEGDIVQPYVELSKKFDIGVGNVFTPSLKGELGIPAKGNAKEQKGLHIHSSLKYDWEMTKAISLSQKGCLVYDDGAYAIDKALVGSYEIAPSVKVADWLSLNVSAKAIGPLTKVNDGRKLEMIYGAGLNMSF